MTDDLVMRLNELSTPERRKHGSLPDIAMKEAADRLDEIKELEAEVARLKENCYEQYKRINELEAALRKLDDMVCELDAGNLQLFEVGDFIDAAIAGDKQ